MEPEYLTVTEVAAKLRVSRVTVWRWLSAGLLAGPERVVDVGTGSRKVPRIPAANVQAFLDRDTTTTEEP